jgi:aryl-alcohol dehydrogenase-like predicted oxidoreductase
MHTTRIDDIEIPALGFGCASMLGRVGRRASLLALARAWDAGMRLFDVAPSYGYGEAETLLGTFLRGRRHGALLITKFGLEPQPVAPLQRALKPVVRAALRLAPAARQSVRRQLRPLAPAPGFDILTLHASVERSLRALQTDCIDVLLAHEAPASIGAQEDLLDALEQLRRSGKIRCAGVSGANAIAALTAAPDVLRVAQFPAPLFASAMPAANSNIGLRMANHVFGGTESARTLQQRMASLTSSQQLSESLQARLRLPIHALLAQLAFSAARNRFGAQTIIASMFQPAHLQANLEALSSPAFNTEDLAAIEAALQR